MIAAPPTRGRTHGRIAGRPAPAQDAPCAHCGDPLGSRPVWSDEKAFCCTGCAVVYRALAEAGFDQTYYRLRDLTHDRRGARPPEPDPLGARELAAPAFLAEHTRALDGGLRQVELFVDGVHCAACVWLVERMPYEVDGVADTRLDLPRARATLTFDPARVRLSEVASWLARFGYTARPAREAGMRRRTEAERDLLVRMGVTWAIAGNIMLLAFALYSGLDTASDTRLAAAARWISLGLAIPAVVYGGRPFFSRAWASVGLAWRARDPRRLHMDTPIALGVLAGFTHSAWATVTGRGDVWFDSIAVLIAALLTARWLQLRSRRFAGEATERLLALVPTMARRVGEDGECEAVPIAGLRRGDVVEVPAGEVVPVDGEVLAGESRLDVAVLTGESRPAPVGPGGRVEAGATNLSAPLRVRVEAVGEATRVGRLLAWVRDAESHRAPVVLLADRLGGWFVLAVLALAALTAVIWADDSRALAHVAALLVVTCPCALSMATPLSMAVAAGRAARRGLFVKSDEATQRVTEVDTVVLDKTGTLTEGRMALVNWTSSEEALDLAAALEAQATHPVAEALVRARGVDPALAVTEVEMVPGAGIRGRVAGHAIIVGRPAWVGEQLPGGLPAYAIAALTAWAAEGHTPVALAVDGDASALSVGDALRDDAAAFVRDLEARGAEVHLLSGDDPVAVTAVSNRLGLRAGRARGGVGPEAKRGVVADLQSRGRVVLMIGDGVNDAAALRQADVGVAVGGGTTASLVAADVFLTRPGLAPVAELLDGSASVMRTIRVTLGISLLYNVAGATAAAAGLVTPLIAAVAMPVSSVLVVAMALLQPSFRRGADR